MAGHAAVALPAASLRCGDVTAFTSADLRTGAQLMYYGGDLVEIALAATLAVQWYAARRRTPRSPRSRSGLAPCSTDGRFREGEVPER
ncbi:hypothetical protein AB0M31_08810 [Streptomyces sp. NPDC051773]|uniref:hypothetical protein n=1 Tax=Streptomyces sp. NPDC051773 TaxID=3156682 RepID=UPI00341FCCAA